MATPFVGEIRMTGFNFAPDGWFLCNGQSLPISEYEVLFNLIGTTYGGNGQTTFNLPDLQGRIPFHQGTSNLGQTMVIGQIAGEESVTLLSNQMPVHSHALGASSVAGGQASPVGVVWASSNLGQFSTEAPSHAMAPSVIGQAGGGQPHDNLPPFLVVNFIIAWAGIYPSQG
jgi:microcystin-dependent protein